MRANGSPPPVFETDDDRSACVVRLPVHPLARGPAPEVTPQVPPPSCPQVPPEVCRIVRLLAEESSRQQLQQALGLNNGKHFREAYLHPAIAAGLVQMTHPDKPRSSNQRYRLTSDGQQWLKMHTDN
jgi:ATP-dependent DNA helicase RecG